MLVRCFGVELHTQINCFGVSGQAGFRLSTNPTLLRCVLRARDLASAGDWEGLPPILGQFEDWALIPRLFGRVSMSARPDVYIGCF